MKQARWIVAAVALVAAGLGWWAVSGIRSVHADAQELSWLRSDGDRVTAKVEEVGWADAAGLPQTVWVRTPEKQACFVDLAGSKLSRSVGAEIAVVLDRREAAICEGVGSDNLTRNFTGDYVRKAAAPVALLIVLLLGVVVLRRKVGLTVARVS